MYPVDVVKEMIHQARFPQTTVVVDNAAVDDKYLSDEVPKVKSVPYSSLTTSVFLWQIVRKCFQPLVSTLLMATEL
jgi:hypothetical protein